ncbi:phosphonate C-P lyase system protein PhnG [Chachezhania antarctica]|uniref:phosphonate C-P lyase system protein PhnG n=1 Tax=Chachezhania antarctica TaxID=2340860 RepID=UPI000EAD6D8D|nr:phosphonate C-P lyase system protein PhnG [Chachezhania antarctica]|tara:strand:- start:9296 stop:9751 length:456 start_codon:yes stop_codon:yes gene_type:complete
MPTTEPAASRQRWMSVLARAPERDLIALWDAFAAKPAFEWLRRPETGAVMVRGRMGGTGGPFNLGEMTVTRCSVQTDGGLVGHAYVQGRSQPKAEAAALIDALMQGGDAARVEAEIVAPLETGMTEKKQVQAAKAAATRVNFFTMARGEDE